MTFEVINTPTEKEFHFLRKIFELIILNADKIQLILSVWVFVIGLVLDIPLCLWVVLIGFQAVFLYTPLYKHLMWKIVLWKSSRDKGSIPYRIFHDGVSADSLNQMLSVLASMISCTNLGLMDAASQWLGSILIRNPRSCKLTGREQIHLPAFALPKLCSAIRQNIQKTEAG